jgi:WD40 repeat protein
MKSCYYYSRRLPVDDDPIDKKGAGTGRVRLRLVDRKLAGMFVAAAVVLPWVIVVPDANDHMTTSADNLTKGVPITSFAFSPDNTLVAATDTNQRAALCNRAEYGSGGRFLATKGHAWAVAFSPDSRYLALGGVEPDIILCDLKPGGSERPLGVPIVQTTKLAFSRDGRTLAATSGATNEIILWDMNAMRLRMRLLEMKSPAVSIALAPDGQTLASGAKNDRAIVIWDLATGLRRHRLELKFGPAESLAYSPDGTLLASASGCDRAVRVWDSRSGRLVHLIEGPGPLVNSVAFSANGRMLATVGEEGRARVWRVATWQEHLVLAGETKWLCDVAFSPDDQTLAARSSMSGAMQFWNLAGTSGGHNEPLGASAASSFPGRIPR